MNRGTFIEGYYLVGFIAAALLAHHPGAAIIHDPRLTWNTIDMVQEAGGRPVMCKTGHAFIKERMRAENALYGGEMSGHHYFRDFAYCDSGMIPWLLVLESMCRTGQPLSALVRERMARYPCSGEINRKIARPRCGRQARRGALSGRSHRDRPHRRPQPGIPRLAFQPAPIQHRTGPPPQCGDPARPGPA